jgi:hypothetical protein
MIGLAAVQIFGNSGGRQYGIPRNRTAQRRTDTVVAIFAVPGGTSSVVWRSSSSGSVRKLRQLAAHTPLRDASLRARDATSRILADTPASAMFTCWGGATLASDGRPRIAPDEETRWENCQERRDGRVSDHSARGACMYFLSCYLGSSLD